MATLADFIRDNTEPILAEWEAFARGLPHGSAMDIPALRDHAKEMLEVMAADLSETQTPRQRVARSQGRSDAALRGTPTAAQAHGAGRADSGFTVDQMVSEFRALRASVIHLWTKTQQEAAASALEDMVRFNEAIDQAIAESISTYAHEVTRSKDRFLAILGHDLRTPIGAMVTSTRFMLDTGQLGEPHLSLVTRMEGTARRMNRLVSDLLEFARTRFGDRIPIVIDAMDARRMLDDAAAELRASFSAAEILVSSSGETCGRWDCERLTQAVINLASNAVHHGARGSPIEIDAIGSTDELVIAVRNQGPVIPPEQIEAIFDGMKSMGAPRGEDRRHLGLGLYIVDKIARAHGGSIEVESTDEGGTVFRLRVPRVAA